MIRYLVLFVVGFLAVPLFACVTEEPPPAPADMEGQYNLVGTQRDSDCLPELASIEQVWGFMDEAASGIRVMTMSVAQDGADITATLGPSNCTLTGVADAAATMTLGGDCHESDVARTLHLAVDGVSLGAGWEIEGTMTIEVDTQDADGVAGADGVEECVVTANIEGTGL